MTTMEPLLFSKGSETWRAEVCVSVMMDRQSLHTTLASIPSTKQNKNHCIGTVNTLVLPSQLSCGLI